MIHANLVVLVGALLLDAVVGDPDALWRRIPHPVTRLGRAIHALDRTYNVAILPPEERRQNGVIAMAFLFGGALAAGVALEVLFHYLPFGWIGRLVVATIFLAARSLYDHVAAVATAFDQGLAAARSAVSRIVGRDPETLDEAGIARAAVESTAENFSDGVVAPALWFVLLGLPGLILYKAINTADSMIGHLNPKYRDFGRAAALIDDAVNLPASRLAGALLALAAPVVGGSIADAFRTMVRDAGRHRSPNAGWPEAAAAGALGIALAGPRTYGGATVDDPYMNASGRKLATRTDIRRGLRLYVAANGLLLVLVAAGAWLLS